MAPKTPAANSKLPKPPTAGGTTPLSAIPAANVLQRRTLPTSTGTPVSKALKDMTPEQQALLAEAISMHSPGLIDMNRNKPTTTPTTTTPPTTRTLGTGNFDHSSPSNVLGFTSLQQNNQRSSSPSNSDRASPTGFTTPLTNRTPTKQIGRRPSSSRLGMPLEAPFQTNNNNNSNNNNNNGTSTLQPSFSNTSQQYTRPGSQNGYSPLSASTSNLPGLSSTPSPTGTNGNRALSGSPSGSKPTLPVSRLPNSPALGAPAFSPTGSRTSQMKQPMFQRPPGTTTNTGSTIPQTKNPLGSIPGSPAIVPPSLDNFEIGDRVIVESMDIVGILRFIGPTEFKTGTWAGIELDTPTGKNDGSVGDVVYFQCRPKYGIFVLAGKLAKSELLFPPSPEHTSTPSPSVLANAPASPAQAPQLTSHAAQAASKISAGSRASKYIGMTASQLKQRNVLPQLSTVTTTTTTTGSSSIPGSRISQPTQSNLPGSSMRAPSPTVKSLGGMTGSPTAPRTMTPINNGRANSPSPVPKQVLRSSSPTARVAASPGSRLSQTAAKPTISTLNSKSGHSRSPSSASSVASQSSTSGARARTSPTPRAITTPRRLSSRSETPDISSLISPSESRSNLLDQATTIQTGTPQEVILSQQLSQMQQTLDTAVAENELLKSEVNEKNSRLELNKMLEKKELTYEDRNFLSKNLNREMMDDRVAKELEELHEMKASWDKEKAAKDQELKVVTEKMTQAWLDAARSQKERTALIQEKTELAEKLRLIQENGGLVNVEGGGSSSSAEQQALIETLQKNLQEADEKTLALESKLQDLSARAIEEEERLNRVNEDTKAASEAKYLEIEQERDLIQSKYDGLVIESQSKFDEISSKLKDSELEATETKSLLADVQIKLNEVLEFSQQHQVEVESKIKSLETDLLETQSLLAKSEKLARGFEERAKESEIIVAKRDQDIVDLKLELQNITGMVQSEEVDRMRNLWELEKKHLEEAVADNITIMTELRAEIRTLEENEERLLDDVRALDASNISLSNLRDAAQSEVAQLQSLLKHAEVKFIQERQVLKNKFSESESALEVKLSETKERLEYLEGIALTVEEWKERCEAMQLEMIQKTAAVQDLSLKVSETEAREEEFKNQVEKLRQELEKNAAQSTTIENSRAEVVALEEEREQLLVKVSELEAALALSVSAPRATSSGASDSEGALSRTEWEEEITALKQMVHELTAENASVASDNKKLMQEHDILMEAHKHVETECLKLMDEVERLHSESLAVSMGEGEITSKDNLDLIHHKTGTKTLIGQEELKVALSNVAELSKDTPILPSEKQGGGQNQSASVIRLEGLLKDKQATLDRLTQAHSLEMRDLRQRYVELDRTKSWEITQLNKELTDLESLIESKIFHEADLEEEVQQKQKQIDRLQHEVSELRAQISKLPNGAVGLTSDLPPNGLSSDRRANTSYSTLTSVNGDSKSPTSGDRSRTFTNSTDKSPYCEVCEVEGHDLVGCVAVFGDAKRSGSSAAHVPGSDAPLFSEADLEDDRPYCDNCEEFGLHYTDECPNELLTY